MNLTEAAKALRVLDWSDLLAQGVGTKFAALVDGEAVLGTVVESSDNEDEDNDRDLSVTVEVAGQYFRRTGWSQIGSHCYGDYEPSWNEIKEVRPREKTITVYEVI